MTTRIDLSQLMRLRWGAAFGQIGIIWFVTQWLAIDVALAPLLTLVGLGFASNVACALWLRRAPSVADRTLRGFEVRCQVR